MNVFMQLKIPDLCLVALIGTTGSGKSTFARAHFLPTEVISSDYCRGLVSDDENSQSATNDAFDVLHYIAAKRLRAGRIVVVDATNVQPESRKSLIALAREHDCLAAAIVLDLPDQLCHDRNASRPDRQFGEHVIRNQKQSLRRSLRGLEREGFRYVYVLKSEEEVAAAEIIRQPLWNNKRHERGPFDIIGDVHGCYDELEVLLQQLGYTITSHPNGTTAAHPQNRKAIFVGDLVDRGPRTPDVLKLVINMVQDGTAMCVAGNHDVKLMRKLKGRDVRITHGLAESLQQLEPHPDEFKTAIVKFIDGLIGHYVLDEGNLVVAHAGLKEAYQGRSSSRVRDFGLYGETTGETDEYGLPIRYNWAQDYRGKAMVVYGHTPVPEPEWLNKTVCVDTGCVFGGKLTALRYPEREFVSVDAAQTYYESVKPFLPADAAAPPLAPKREEGLLDIDDVLGKRIIETRFERNITIREENAIAALEVMSRFAINPKWLVYLPPTMSPCETSKLEGYLEYPTEAFNYYFSQGVPRVICEEKHMGSRAVLVVCRDERVAEKHFGVHGEGRGVCYTRTGRPFFNDAATQAAVIDRTADALTAAGIWDELKTDWLILDCELMPWSAKAQELLRQQYAAVGAAGLAALPPAVSMLEETAKRGLDVSGLLSTLQSRVTSVDLFREAYRRYCWEVQNLNDLKIAPFHLLASEGKVHDDRGHEWHMQTLARLPAADPDLFVATKYSIVDLTSEESREAGTNWWLKLTESGREGMVVKPMDFVVKAPRGLTQPAVKCRGKEYLRIIYGPDYDTPDNLARLRNRGLGRKRSLAAREFSLGLESMHRFISHEPLFRVHECAFGVLALESEPVDPRL